MPKIIVSNRVYIPCELVDEKLLIEHYDHYIYMEKTCAKCPVVKAKKQRPAIIRIPKSDGTFKEMNCLSCDWGGFTGHFQSYSKVNIKGHPYWTVPSGNLRAVRKNLGISFKGALDIRFNKSTRYPLTFTKKLFTGKEKRKDGSATPNQIKVIETFLAAKGQTGVIKAAPRAGKTVLATYLTCELGKPTIIMAHEKLLLDQFYNTFIEFTDIRRQEKRAGKKLLVIAKTQKDLDLDVPYLLVNYQKFITDLGIKRVVKHLSKRYSVIIVDEIHRSSSDKYNALLNRLDPRHRIGLTATDNRKDGKYILTIETLGRVVAEDKTPAMQPIVYVKKTDFKPPRQWRGKMAYGNATRWLAKHKERNIDIIKQVFTDLRKNDLHSIVIPVPGVNHAKKLTRMINKQAAYNNINKGEKWSKELAVMLWAGVKDKEAVLDKARHGKCRVVVAITKFVRDGINVPRWTHIYVSCPGSNTENAYQMTQRVCTYYDGKPQPIIRLWLDPIDILRNCCKNTYLDYQSTNYKFGKTTKETLDSLLESTKIKPGVWVANTGGMGW